MLVGCAQSSVDETIINSVDEYYASFEESDSEQTRTYVDEQVRMRWHKDDYITLFKKNTYNRKFMFTGKTGANAGGFRQVSVDDDYWFGYDVDASYAVYPHSDDTELDESSCAITLTMPAEQTYAENSFGLEANTMVAVSSTNQLIFKNVGCYLRVRLYGEDTKISSIILTSKGNEAISGKAIVTPVMNGYPSCEMIGSGKSITLTCPSPVTISESADSPTDFWIVVPPVTLKSGFSVTVTNSNDEEQTYDVDQSFTFARNTYYNLKREVTLNETTSSTEVPSNQIWYTTTDEKVLYPYNSSAFGASIISNTYENGKGIITFDSDVAYIGTDAFREKKFLESIKIPNTVTKINEGAFYLCTNLLNIIIPQGVVYIGDSAFSHCSSLTTINIPEGVLKIGEPGDNGGYTFAGCSSLTSIAIPNSVTSVCRDMFEGCTSLSTVTLGTGLKTIKMNMFSDCTSLSSITIPENITKIDNGAFVGCENLTNFYGKFASSDNNCLITDGVLVAFAPKDISEYTIPNSVTSIKEHTFQGCIRLTNINIPNSVLSIGEYAFANCINLMSICIPETITIISHNCFLNCTSISNINLPHNIEKIESYAFRRCNNLTSITIPERVSKIENYAFDKCDKLTSVYFKPTAPPTIYKAFYDTPSSLKLYVPTASYETYLEAWSTYGYNIDKWDIE